MIDWRHWHNEPYLVGGLLLLGWIYAVVSGPLRRRLGGPTPRPARRAGSFGLSLLLFYLAVGSPLDQIGERFLLTAHMVQHLLLIYPAAALLLLGIEPWMLAPLYRRPAGVRALGHPVVCGTVSILAVTLWHAPALYNWALADKVVHVWEHLVFFAAGLLFWWPLLRPAAEQPPLRPGAQILYLVAVAIGMTPLFAFITFSSDVLYPTYEFAPRIIPALSVHSDQLLAGVVMKFANMGVALLMIALAFARWYRRETRSGQPQPEGTADT